MKKTENVCSNSRDQLVDFVAEVRKMEVIFVDEAHIVQNLQEGNLEFISFGEFKNWSQGPSGNRSPEASSGGPDPFGSKGSLPERFSDVKNISHSVKIQHPCFTTSAHDVGMKRPNQVDMPVKWRGKEVNDKSHPVSIYFNQKNSQGFLICILFFQGDFTRDFEMKEPGKNTITVNNFVNRGLRTNKSYSRVHREFDIDW